MPNKTVYVSDDDLPLFQRAQELVGGNLSGAIVTALRRYIELEEGRAAGFDETVLRVGHNGARQVRFSGRLLAEASDMGEEAFQRIRVFHTRKGKYVVHQQRSEWVDYPTDTNWLKDLTNWRRMFGVTDPDWGDFSMDIYDASTDLKGKVPDKLYERISDLSEHPRIEDLDI
ncbi:EXLDI protein [Nocardia spumae]|uniref:EXLDI protein n=1 Tax=Nocardia spumae TaxID=2887190 RepID=UPI001D14261C|nr:EXLDI protein [Nocardia spumae]